MKIITTYVLLAICLLSFLACNFGGTKKDRYYGDKSEQLKNKTYNDFYEKEGRAPREDEKVEIDVWADSISRVGGVLNDDGYSTEFGTKETKESIYK